MTLVAELNKKQLYKRLVTPGGWENVFFLLTSSNTIDYFKLMRTRKTQKPSEKKTGTKKKESTRTRKNVHIDLTGFDLTEGIPPEDEWTEEQRAILTKPLTIRETMIVHEYLKDFKKMAAVKRAGGKNTDCFRRPNVRYAIHKKIQKILNNKTELAAKTLGELEIVGRSDITDFIAIGQGKQITKLKDLEKIDTRAIASVEVDEQLNMKRNVIERKVKLRLWDKPRTLDTLSKVTELQSNNIKLSGDVNVHVDLEGWKKKCRDRLLENQEEKKKEFKGAMEPDDDSTNDEC